MLARPDHEAEVRRLLRVFPVAAIVGARQVGKTSLARSIHAAWEGPAHWFDLEDPRDRALSDDPIRLLDSLRGLVVVDEIHRAPGLFEVLRVLADQEVRPQRRFLVLGSATWDLLGQGTESLAGRIGWHQLSGFDLGETGPDATSRLWFRGGFPRPYLAGDDSDSLLLRDQLARALIEKDLPSLGIAIEPASLGRLWAMVAHAHGNVWNHSEIARSFGVSHTTVRNWLDLLLRTFLVRLLAPWHENLGKRQVKSPKAYVADPGLLHSLLGVRSPEDLLRHPKSGASWEGFVIAQVQRAARAAEHECFFWATHQGAELDLLLLRGGRRVGVEVKLNSAPGMTPSMRRAMEDLRLDRLFVVHAGQRTWAMADGVEAMPLEAAVERVRAALGPGG